MTTIKQIIGDFDDYVKNWARRRDDIPYEIKTSIISEIIRTRSIDTTRFIQSVDFREEAYGLGGYRYLIDSARDYEVTYAGFLEFGTNTNAYGVRISPRLNYQHGIENSNLDPIFDDIADSSFAR